ncbi:MAG TPA: hypothetical protein VNT01_09540 [Symbiobacteriaceae bacterium]|nr:hypothetical protein [Symbiobacteriaceae bacterium]
MAIARSRGWKVFLVVLILLLAAAGVVLALTGVVPSLSGLVGADQPRDLGVRVTVADRDRVVQDVSSLFKPAPAASGAGGKVQAAPAVIDREFTEAELSALLTYQQGGDWPVQSGQVRIHADGMLEISVALVTKELPPAVLQYLPRALPELLPLFVRGRLGIAGAHEVALEVERFEIGRMPMPSGAIAALDPAEMINAELRSLPGLHLTDLVFAEGRVRVQGTYQP